MNIRNLFFLGSILLLLSCKNSKQQEGYNSCLLYTSDAADEL